MSNFSRGFCYGVNTRQIIKFVVYGRVIKVKAL